MGLQCLLGHDFGGVEMERSREEDGDEMVVTTREVKTCRRCGKRRTVSENTEVTSIKSPDDVGLSGTSEGLSDGDRAEGDDGGGVAGEGGDDVESGDDGVAGGTGTDRAAGPGVEEGASGVADADDGIILDEGDDEREPGEWAEATRDQEAETRDSSDAGSLVEAAEGGDDEAPDPEDGVEIIEDDAGAGTEPEAPDAAEAGDDISVEAAANSGDRANSDHGGAGDAASSQAPDTDGLADDSGGGDPTDADGDATGDVAPDPIRRTASIDDRSSATAVDTEFFCPNCDHVEAAVASSLRAGDICPECAGGYIAEREQ